jgi:hypothetical protein
MWQPIYIPVMTMGNFADGCAVRISEILIIQEKHLCFGGAMRERFGSQNFSLLGM